MADIVQNTVSDDELVARIVSKEWVIEGTLMPQAFELAPKETYLSVNRLSVASYEDDVCKFVKNHPLFLSDDSRTYQRAVLGVSNIRVVKVLYNGDPLQIDVEVEPRDAHTLSHAGIFVKSGGKNVVLGRPLGNTLPEGISAEMVLQQIQWELLELAELQECKITEGKQE
ncbi:MAG: hypothetical protein J6O49_11295 [Bacteroidaceae bacterium]|jgi:hypothetical protein|nr:hypothetical protein [Bacteroidaceae bacterium]